MTCECRVCRYSREVDEHLAALPEPHRAFFADMYERLCHAEFDNDWTDYKIETGSLVHLSEGEQIMLKFMMTAPDAEKIIEEQREAEQKKDIDGTL